jgi:2-polyprenyl-6-hydroxyphenyl methylase/3-demethylubiquinone-9 3-methyltransferase
MEVTPPIWSEQLESMRDPNDCTTCPYFKRSQPWAHLKYQREFNTLFPFPMFKTLDGGYLNKMTIFQIRQFALEAGFDIELEERYWLMNTIDLEPLKDYPVHDLVTFQYLLRLRKTV